MFGRKRCLNVEAPQRPYGVHAFGRRASLSTRPALTCAGPRAVPCGLLDGYAAALTEVADLAGRLEAGDLSLRLRVTDLPTVLEAALAAVTPLATAARLEILSEPAPRAGACVADPALLGLVLRHLMLAALTREDRPAEHLRLRSGVDGGEAFIAILSRTPATPPKDADLDDAHALLQAMGADLSIGPPGAGYLPTRVRLKLAKPADAVAQPVPEAA